MLGMHDLNPKPLLGILACHIYLLIQNMLPGFIETNAFSINIFI